MIIKNPPALGPLFAILAFCFLVWPSAMGQNGGAAKDGNDWLLVPDRRAGPITRNWTGADLMRAFGTLHCRKAEIGVGEGETVPGYRIYPDTVDELEILLDPETGKIDSAVVRMQIEFIEDPNLGASGGMQLKLGPETRWHSISGITTGSTVGEVAEVNGRPFKLGEWETDNAGVVSSWENGKIPDSFHVRFLETDLVAYSAFWQKLGTNGVEFQEASDSAMIASFKPIVYLIRIEL